MRLQRNSIVTVLDIGSSKIVCLVAKIGADSSLQVIGGSERATRGVRAGVITDIYTAKDAIARTVEAAQQTSGVKIKQIYVSIPSTILLSQRISASISVLGHEINYKDLNKLLLEVLSTYQKQPLEIIHSFAYNYILDGNHGISNPLGMYGDNLACEMHVLTIPSNLLLNLTNAVTSQERTIENYISSAYANGLACLTKDEMEMGVTLIDIGAGHTSISLFEGGHMIFTDAIALGGFNITSDIAKCLCTSLLNAERLKNLQGTAINNSVDKNDVIEVPLTDFEDSEVHIVRRSLLAEIIRARIEEILSLLEAKLRESNLVSANKIVMVGSGSKLHGIQEAVSEIFGIKTRIGTPHHLKGLADGWNNSGYTTAIGMLTHIMEYAQKEVTPKKQNQGNGIVQTLRRMLDIF